GHHRRAPLGQPRRDVGPAGGEPAGRGVQDRAAFGQRYARFGQGANLNKPQQVAGGVAPVAGPVAPWFLDQAEPVIVPHGLDRDAGECRHAADRQTAGHVLTGSCGSRGGTSRTASAIARKSLRRIAPWLLATFALTLMLGLRAVTRPRLVRTCSCSVPRLPKDLPEATT